MAKIHMNIFATLAATAVLALAPASAGAGPLGTPQGLRAALSGFAMVEQVDCRHSRRYRCSRGQRNGSIIIEPARAPRSYYVDYQAYGAQYGWYGY